MRDSSVEMLQGYLTSILQSIVASVDQCPPVMRVVFKQLHKRVEEQFVQPENEVSWTLEADSKRKEMTLHKGKVLKHVLKPWPYGLYDHQMDVYILNLLSPLSTIYKPIKNIYTIIYII